MSERICKYNCGQTLEKFDTKANKFLEKDGKTLHTQERCEEIKAKKEVDNWANGNNNHRTEDISLELVLRKLEVLGIKIDLQVLKNVEVPK